MRSCLVSLVLSFALALPAAASSSPAPQLLREPSPLVRGEEFSRRLLSPLSADDVHRFLQAGGRRLAPESFSAGADAVDLYVPAKAPPGGYGLLVFIPPADEFPLPRDWHAALEKRGLIVAMPRKAGNDADVIGRRIPLALHAHHHATANFAIDPTRVYVGGFSGGARLAQRIAIAWPDVFRGSLQFAGSVVVGENLLPPPPRDLLDLARQRSRFVLVSGSLDLPNRRNDAEARARLESLCFAGVRGFGPPRLDHWVPEGRAFAKALEQLEAPVPADADDACASKLDAEVAQALDAVEDQLARGDAAGARNTLTRLDDQFGGLAAPRSHELARRIMAALPVNAD